MKTHFLKTCTIIGISLLFSANSYAQTKEETITWLKEKLGKYMMESKFYTTIRLVSIDECKIVFSYSFDDTKYIEILPTSINEINNGHFRYSSNVASNQREGHELKYDNMSNLQLGYREDKIEERVEKALKHLATFCPKKTETF
uniref:hypothetical protein n=1 Tax=Flavobacterium sp. TaxID=239 RepID=UPI00404B80C0